MLSSGYLCKKNLEILRKDEENIMQKETAKKKKTGLPSCAVAKKCGGCQYQGVSYEKQLLEKQKQIEKLLKPFGKVEPIIGMKNPYHYRNKVHAVFGYERGRGIVSGTYQANTHKIVPVEECLIEDEKCTAIIRSIRELLKSFKIKTYDEDTGYGLFRHVLVRRGFSSGEIMVVLVLSGPILPSKNNFVAALRKLHPEITTIVLNINDKRTSMVLGEKEKVLYGKGYIEDTLCGCTFRISARSFYQVNPVQTEILYGKAMEYANLTGKERVLDAYCGIGTIGLIAAKTAKEVIGVEVNGDAVRDARVNAKINSISNAQFYQADAGTFMVSLAEQQISMDVVFMDPPRAGSDEAFLSSAVKLFPKRIVYISCNPETLARDLKYLTKHGYQVRRMQPVDMFGFTEHTECVTLLQKSK
jgi:23S rRNA (uracil1939-C5)-methyltransferase